MSAPHVMAGTFALAAADFERRANLHRPTSRDALAAEIRRLVASGLKPADVAGALRISMAEVQAAAPQVVTTAGVIHR